MFSSNFLELFVHRIIRKKNCKDSSQKNEYIIDFSQNEPDNLVDFQVFRVFHFDCSRFCFFL
ncbi:hypothetical protein DERF_014940 [Dermatophagoides farinae]|uniref:Uncharacterized protein n=1 Tax=Dermatophagoides farinae TaxID=6954 RepID=A0A922HK96_DERFA|nr:hypothetical protein DERF_014940 [Dermatophagoides farinae]